MDAVLASFVVDVLNSLLNFASVVLLAWIGGQQHASAVERERRKRREEASSSE